MQRSRLLNAFLIVLVLMIVVACSKREAQPRPDNPRLTPNVRMQDVVFRSSALGRNMQYRVILPKNVTVEKMPIVYLLHGGDSGFRDWSNYSDVARYAEKGLILVMPQGDESYYTNSATRQQDRYEDYIANDLIAEVEARFPAARGRAHRAILGVSMGGFGAVKIALKRPELFSFVGGLSPAMDVPTRPFSIKRIGQWRHHRSIFGEWQGAVQKQNDPNTLAEKADPTKAPYFYLTCGDQEGLLPANSKFARIVSQNNLRYEFHVVSGGHNWVQWNANIPGLFAALLQHISSSGDQAGASR